MKTIFAKTHFFKKTKTNVVKWETEFYLYSDVAESPVAVLEACLELFELLRARSGQTELVRTVKLENGPAIENVGNR